jgi:hypothetical protein
MISLFYQISGSHYIIARIMKRIFLCLILSCVFLFIFNSRVLALKKRVRKPRAQGISFSSVQVFPNTHSVALSLFNLGSIRSVAYELSYSSWDVSQGAMGSIFVSGQTADSRDLYFGTCSHGVCTPHYGLGSQASLLVCADLTNGTEWCKRYNINTKRLQ